MAKSCDMSLSSPAGNSTPVPIRKLPNIMVHKARWVLAVAVLASAVCDMLAHFAGAKGA